MAVNAGNTVIAIKYKDGVMMIADTACSYGSQKAIKNYQRMTTVGDNCIYGATGEMSDFQVLKKNIDDAYEEDYIENDGALYMGPREYFNWHCAHQYQRRCKGKPQLITTLFAGVEGGNKFLGFSDSRGLKIEHDFCATGFGDYFC